MIAAGKLRLFVSVKTIDDVVKLLRLLESEYGVSGTIT